MKLSQLKVALSTAAKMRRPVFIEGGPGMGKSAIVEETCIDVASRLGLQGVAHYGHVYDEDSSPVNYFGLHDVRLSQCEPVDIRGLPVPDIAADATCWLVPDWFPHAGRHDLPNKGILFLDEANGAPASVQAAAYQLVHDRRIGDKVMKTGWSIVLAGNRMTDGGVTFKMPLPLCNRLIHVSVESDLTEWRNWANDIHLSPEVVAFVAFRPDLLNNFEEHVTKKFEGKAFCTERSWHIVADLMKAEPPAAVFLDMLNGIIGKGPAAEFYGFLEVWRKMPSIEGIFAAPETAPLPKESDQSGTATLFAISAALANRATEQNGEALITYASRMPAEFGVMTIRDAVRRNNAIASLQAFTTWSSKHMHLFSA